MTLNGNGIRNSIFCPICGGQVLEATVHSTIDSTKLGGAVYCEPEGHTIMLKVTVKD